MGIHRRASAIILVAASIVCPGFSFWREATPGAAQNVVYTQITCRF
jgi:hypothetical protein